MKKNFIDILAFDEELNAPIIIELKRENEKGLFDQGMEYFNILFDRKSDFLLKLHEVLGIPAELKNIDWSSSRVMFIGSNFTQRQKKAIDFKGIPIELWEYNLYQNNFFQFNQVGLDKKINLEIDIVKNKNKSDKIKKEFREYDLEYHLKKGSEKTKEMFQILREKIFKIDTEITEKYLTGYVAYKIKNKNIIGVRLQKEKMIITFSRTKPQDLKDLSNKLIYNEKSMEYYNQHTSNFLIDNVLDIDYVIDLIKEAFNKY